MGTVIPVNFRANVAERVVVNNAAEVQVKTTVIREVVLAPDGCISNSQWAKIKNLITEWYGLELLMKGKASMPELIKRTYNVVRTPTGKGVTKWEYIPEAELEHALKYVRSQMARIKQTSKYRHQNPEALTKDAIKSIFAELRKRGISKSRFKEYLLGRYGTDSTRALMPEQLLKLAAYVKSGGSCEPKGGGMAEAVQKKREQALSDFLRSKCLSSDGLDMKREEVHHHLASFAPALFEEISGGTFNDFWRIQNLCRLKGGRRSKNQENPFI